jgi:hypothetical protein
VIAGNKTVEQAAQIGLDDIVVVDSDGSKLVAVRRTDIDLDSAAGRELAIADNRTSELGLEWDTEALEALQREGVNLGAFWNQDELDALLVSLLPETSIQEGIDPDDIPDEAPTRVSYGDLWELGRHRLLCGDSTDAENVAALLEDTVPPLMVTDVPYGVNYDPDWRNEAAAKGLISFAARNVGTVTNDHRVDWSTAYGLFPGDVAYVWHAGLHAAEVSRNLEETGFSIVSQIIWAKSHFAISRGDYHWRMSRAGMPCAKAKHIAGRAAVRRAPCGTSDAKAPPSIPPIRRKSRSNAWQSRSVTTRPWARPSMIPLPGPAPR